MELFILMMAIPVAVLVARHTWRVHLRVAELFHTAPVGTRIEPASVGTGPEPVAVRITAVLAVGRSLLVAVRPHPIGDGEPPVPDQVLVGQLFEADGGAALAVLDTWCGAGTPVVMHLGADRLTFQAQRGSSIVLAAAS